MAGVWIEDLANQHCPTCDAWLVARAGKFEPLGKPTPTYVQDGAALYCPAGHRLPDERALAAYQVERGHEPPPLGSPVREVPPPQ